ncbi:hypothetical protein [Rhizobium sp. 007]|uniref:hypothetical protein n=1 Tax=Rhizobium sp. 007 TaxID=2785056 RepID=UPI001FED8E4B|nr:hypothetical protein [Rhizobium sp. 007]
MLVIGADQLAAGASEALAPDVELQVFGKKIHECPNPWRKLTARRPKGRELSWLPDIVAHERNQRSLLDLRGDGEWGQKRNAQTPARRDE